MASLGLASPPRSPRPAGCGDIPAPSAAAVLLRAFGAVPTTAPALLCAAAGASVGKSLPSSRCPPSPPPRLEGGLELLAPAPRGPTPPNSHRGSSPARPPGTSPHYPKEKLPAPPPPPPRCLPALPSPPPFAMWQLPYSPTQKVHVPPRMCDSS